MKTVKWLIFLFTLLTSVMTQGQNVTNTCSTLGLLQPDQPEKCYRSFSSGTMGCFVSVQKGTTKINFCATVLRFSLNPQAVVELHSDIGKELKSPEVEEIYFENQRLILGMHTLYKKQLLKNASATT